MNHPLIEKIYDTEGQWCLAVTGGGSSALADLFSVPGASGTILEAQVPYHGRALQRYLGATRDQRCDTHTARAMAMRAFERARRFSDASLVFGLGCTAAVATNRDRKGSDRCHIAVQGESTTLVHDLELDRQSGRIEQERQCRDAIINLMAHASGINEGLMPNADITVQIAAPSWQSLINGSAKKTPHNPVTAILPGAFNPIHAGHIAMAECAASLGAGDVALELSIRNVDKPALDYLTMAERERQISAATELNLIFTNAPTFVEKSALFPGVTFVVGLDTLIRIGEAKYYGSSESCDEAIRLMADREVQFLVFGRVDDDAFQTLDNSDVHPLLKPLCRSVPEDQFRMDISSTAIRESQT